MSRPHRFIPPCGSAVTKRHADLLQPCQTGRYRQITRRPPTGRVRWRNVGLHDPWGTLHRRTPDPRHRLCAGGGDADDAGGVAPGEHQHEPARHDRHRFWVGCPPSHLDPAADPRGRRRWRHLAGRGIEPGPLDLFRPLLRLQPALRPHRRCRRPQAGLRHPAHLVRAGVPGPHGPTRASSSRRRALVQGAAAGQLLRACRGLGWRTEVETNGTLSPKRLGDRANGRTSSTSPPSSPRESTRAPTPVQADPPQAIADLLATGRAVWKFVAAEWATWRRSTGGSASSTRPSQRLGDAGGPQRERVLANSSSWPMRCWPRSQPHHAPAHSGLGAERGR